MLVGRMSLPAWRHGWFHRGYTFCFSPSRNQPISVNHTITNIISVMCFTRRMIHSTYILYSCFLQLSSQQHLSFINLLLRQLGGQQFLSPPPKLCSNIQAKCRHTVQPGPWSNSSLLMEHLCAQSAASRLRLGSLNIHKQGGKLMPVTSHSAVKLPS